MMNAPMLRAFPLMILAACLALMSGRASAQSGYEIKLTLDDIYDTEVYMANYFGSKLYYADTTQANKRGVAIFKGTEPFPKGKYAFVLPGPRLFEVLIDEDQHFEMSSDTANFIANVKIKGSESNALYYDYIQFINARKQEVAQLNEDLVEFASDTAKSRSISTRIVEVNKEVQAKQKSMMNDNPDNWAAQVVGMTVPVEIPDAPTDENGNITDSIFQYRYYIKHFFDHVPLKDAGIARTPEFDKKFKEFFNKAIVQSPDTLSKYADEFIKEIEYDDELFKYVVHTLTYSFETSNIMCVDAAFVHMVENYYMKERTPWMDSTNLANVTDRAMRMKPTLCGKTAPQMINMWDTTGTVRTMLHDVQADFTVIYIWDPDCGHCKKENPKIIELQEKYKNDSVKIYSVGYPIDTEPWLAYLRANPEMGKLINVSDGPTQDRQDNFRYFYDTHATPVIILTDKDKKILAKKIGAEQLDEFIQRELDKLSQK